MATSSSTALGQFREKALIYGTAAVTIAAISWAAGSFVGWGTAVGIAVALAVLSYIVGRGGKISVPFVLITVGILANVAGFLPASVVGAFTPFVDAISRTTGLNLGSISPLRLLIYAVTATLVIWVVSIRAFGRAKKPETIAKRVRSRAERLFDTYVTIGRIGIAFGFSMVLIIFANGGELAGEAGSMIAEAPLVASNVATLVAGWFTFVDPIPVLGSLTPLQFWTGVGVIILAAAAVRYG